MLKLYWADDSGALAPQILLEEAGVKYERIEIDLEAGAENSEEYLSINPRGQVPALILDDGSIMTESAAIVLHIADTFPEAKLIPAVGSTQRAKVYRWLIYSVANIYETVLRLYYTDRYTPDADQIEPLKTIARADIDRAWSLLNAELDDGPFFLGQTYSIIDPYLVMLINWHEEPEPLFNRHPKLETLYEAVKQRPATQRIWSQHFSD